MRNHGITVIGAAGSGKTTFLAVNYYLFQIDSPDGILVEADPSHPKSAKLFHEWESMLNQGDFPKKSGMEPITELHLNFWRGDTKISVVDFDPGGEVWDSFNPELEAGAPIPPMIVDYLVSSLGYILIVDSESASKHDSFYQNVLINIRDKMPGFNRKSHKPVIILFTKIDRINNSGHFDEHEFALKMMPKTFTHFNHFFSSLYDPPLLFSCSIGKVSTQGNKPKIAKFEPDGFVEPLLAMFQMANFFDLE